MGGPSGGWSVFCFFGAFMVVVDGLTALVIIVGENLVSECYMKLEQGQETWCRNINMLGRIFLGNIN